MKYSTEFKESAIQKFLSRGNRSVKEVAQVVGVPPQTLYQWRNELGKVGAMKKPTSPQSRPVNEKLKAIAEYYALAEGQRGEYLRKHGLHEEDLSKWQKQVEEAFLPQKKSSEDRAELAAEQKKVKKLEQEIRRKDKALAEASALLILKKKADLIWGTGEDE